MQRYEPLPLRGRTGLPRRLRERGVYLITGGLGGVALELAESLAHSARARLVLVTRPTMTTGETASAGRRGAAVRARYSRAAVRRASLTERVERRWPHRVYPLESAKRTPTFRSASNRVIWQRLSCQYLSNCRAQPSTRRLFLADAVW